ncbi:hypothetical protein MTP04_27670 [Lysinibacillus sp. PLM2]|nr:hypothetical protein MTP04_27670 [Lysinibacillus sp. PLM2]
MQSFNMGYDELVTKPFKLKELIAKHNLRVSVETLYDAVWGYDAISLKRSLYINLERKLNKTCKSNIH